MTSWAQLCVTHFSVYDGGYDNVTRAQHVLDNMRAIM